MLVRAGEHVPLLNVDLVPILEIIPGNRYMLTAEDNFSRYCRAYRMPNKEVHTVAKFLMDQHLSMYGLPDQLHSDNEKEFVNNLWRELFSEFKIHHTTTPPYNQSSNPVEHCHRTLTTMLRTKGPVVQDNWDIWLKAVNSSTGVTPHYTMFGCYLLIGSFPICLWRRKLCTIGLVT